MVKKRMKQALALLLCALLACGTLSMTASAESYSGECGDGVSWSLETVTGALIIAGNGAIQDYAYATQAPWYYQRTSIDTVTIMGGVTAIGDNAFNSCTNLEAVSISSPVTAIGDRAFYGCTKLAAIPLPTDITTIGESAFYNCQKLTNFTLPSALTEIGDSAFYGCKALTNVVIPGGVETVPRYAFYGCTEMTDATLQSGVKEICMYAFSSCTKLANLTIPDSVTHIERYAFIDSAVYKNTSNWTDGVLYIGNHLIEAKSTISGAFDVRDGTICIADSAFKNCRNITSVWIPASVVGVSASAFWGCSDIQYFGVDSANLYFSTINDGRIEDGVLYNKDQTELVCYPQGKLDPVFVIPDSVTFIREKAFEECEGLTNVLIPVSVTEIGESAFSGCSCLESMTIPAGVTALPADLCSNCTKLKSVHIPSSVTAIGGNAFNNCAALSYICSDTKGGYASTYAEEHNIPFQICEGHSTVSGSCGNAGDRVTWTLDLATGAMTISGTGEMADYVESDEFIGTTAPWWAYRSMIKTLTVTDGVTKVGDIAFALCDNLGYVTIANSVTSIGESAFEQCDSLAYVALPTYLASISRYAFDSCTALESVTIPDGVTSIGERAFSYSGLTSVTIPDGVTEIGEYAFAGCAMTEVTIPDGVTTLNEGVFSQCTELTEVTIPDSVTTIGERAFYGCAALESVTIPAGVTGIGDRAFAACESLATITVDPENTSYRTDAFGVLYTMDMATLVQYPIGDTMQTSYMIPTCVTGICAGAFDGCTGLTILHIPASITNLSTVGEMPNLEIVCSETNRGNPFFVGTRPVQFSVCTNHTDTLNPVGEIHSTNNVAPSQTVTLTLSDAVDSSPWKSYGVLGYYWGMSSTYTENTFTYANAAETTVTVTVTEPGTYYLTVKDTSGNVTTESITFFATTFDADGGNVTPASVLTPSGESFTLPTPLQKGYIFDTWRSSTFPFTSYAGSYTPVSNRTLQARWTESDVDSIAIVTEPEKKAYKVGDTLDTTGLTLTVNHVNGTSETISEGFACMPSVLETVGPQEIVVSFGGETDTFEVTVYAYDFTYEIDEKENVAYITGLNDCFAGGVLRIPATVEGTPLVTVSQSELALTMKITGFDAAADSAYLSSDADGVLYDKSGTVLIAYPNANPRTAFTVPNSVDIISDSAFFLSTLLQEINLPDQLEEINDMAFFGCIALQNMTIPDSVRFIGYGAFMLCGALESVNIPASVIKIDSAAFMTGGSLQQIEVDPDNGQYISENGVLYSADGKTLMRYPAAKTDTHFVIPNGVEQVEFGAFINAENLEFVHIPASAEELDEFAFLSIPTASAEDLLAALMAEELDLLDLYLCADDDDGTVAAYAESIGLEFRTCTGVHEGDDTTKPTGAIACSNQVGMYQAVTLTLSDNVGVTGYYWGTSENYEDNVFTTTTDTTVSFLISTAGTYYLNVRDTSRNISDTVSLTLYQTTFDPNGGSVQTQIVTTKSGNSFQLQTPTYADHLFLNWNTEPDGTGTAYTDTYTVTESATLYAQWKVIDNVKPTGAISACTNDVAPTQTVTVTMSDDVGVKGFYFGPYSEHQYNRFFETSETSAELPISSAATYYLTVVDTSDNLSNASTITFYMTTLDADGGTVSPESVLTKRGNSVTLPKAVRAGFKFDKWKETMIGLSVPENYSPMNSLTLTAVWIGSTSISIADMPAKTQYTVGETLDTTGLALTVNYSDGTSETISEGFTCTPTTLDTAGAQTITVRYNGLTTEFTAQVTEPVVAEPKFTLGSGTAAPGETIEIPLSIENNPGIIGLSVSVSYDANVLRLESVENKNLFTGGLYTFGNDLDLIPYILIWEDGLSTTNHTDSGVFAVLTFSVKDGAPAGDTPITLTCQSGSIFDTDLNTVAFDAVGGTVTVPASEEGGWSFSEDSTLHLHETYNGVQFVTGLDPDDPWISDYVETTGGWTFDVELNDRGCESTGAVLNIYNADGELEESYAIVMFGDADGNSLIDGEDVMLIKDAVYGKGDFNWKNFDETDDYPQTYCSDINHDYTVDGQDVMMLKDCIGFFRPCNQNWMEDGDSLYS